MVGILLLMLMLLRPPNPLSNTKKPLVSLRVVAFIGALPIPVEKPVGKEKVLVLPTDISGNEHAVASTTSLFVYGAQGF